VQVIDGCCNEASISNAFATFSSSACSPNNSDTHSQFRDQFVQAHSNYIGDTCCCDITVEEVDNSVRKLKKGKAAGVDSLTAEHVLFAHPIIVVCLTRLFNLMIQHSFVPDSFGVGVMIPLLKNSDGDNTSSENYRGITLSPVLSKIFEHVLVSQFSNFLDTSNLQFGFKAGIGCSDALYTLRVIVDYYTRNGCTLSLAALDISKAFDKISHYGLFLKLMQKNVPKNFIDILACWYSKCIVSVRWGNECSQPFRMQAGVRQGGILSPILFAVYMNEMVEQLNKSGHGCCINGNFLGCLLYADDVLVISQSVCTMQHMLDICTSVAQKLDLRFNVKKSMVLRIGRRYNYKCANLVLSGEHLQFVDEIKYLGVFIKSGVQFCCDYTQTKIKFYRSFNSIYSKCKSELICVNLMKAYCLPVITYACEAVRPNNRALVILDKLVDTAIAKIFKTFDHNNIRFIRDVFELPPVSDIVMKRAGKFVNNFRCKPLSFALCVYNCSCKL
jgi:hypothetical protein